MHAPFWHPPKHTAIRCDDTRPPHLLRPTADLQPGSFRLELLAPPEDAFADPATAPTPSTSTSSGGGGGAAAAAGTQPPGPCPAAGFGHFSLVVPSTAAVLDKLRAAGRSDLILEECAAVIPVRAHGHSWTVRPLLLLLGGRCCSCSGAAVALLAVKTVAPWGACSERMCGGATAHCRRTALPLGAASRRAGCRLIDRWHLAPCCDHLQDRTSRIRDINGYTWQLMEVHSGQVRLKFWLASVRTGPASLQRGACHPGWCLRGSLQGRQPSARALRWPALPQPAGSRAAVQRNAACDRFAHYSEVVHRCEACAGCAACVRLAISCSCGQFQAPNGSAELACALA